MIIKCQKCGFEFSDKIYRLRSIPECRYYFGVVVDILSNELGYSKMETHEILKELFLRYPKHIKTKQGVTEIWITKSTATLTTIEFESYLEQIRQWSSMNLGIYILLPNEEGHKEYNV